MFASEPAGVPNVLYAASGIFAKPAISGADGLLLAGEPFSIRLLANEALKPTKHTSTWAEYNNITAAGLVQSARYPGSWYPFSSGQTTLVLRLGQAGEPDEVEISFPLTFLYLQLSISARATLPPGTMTTTAIRPFTAAVALAGTTMTYADTQASTTLAVASGTLNAAVEPTPGPATLYTFGSQSGDGTGPYAGLVTGKNGTFYGTTNGGGTEDLGTVFELAPPVAPGAGWRETVIHSFAGGLDGEYPLAGVIAAKDGTLYGAAPCQTACGGANLGVVFKLTPPVGAAPGADGEWTETILHTFTGQSDGAQPNAVVLGNGGVLYGTTNYGGKSNAGTVFELTPPNSSDGAWTETYSTAL